MTVLRVMSKLQLDAPASEDVVTNTTHWLTNDFGDATDEAFDVIHDKLGSFYGAIDAYLSENLEPSVLWQVYDLSEAEPRLPIHEESAPIVPGTTRMPNQMAIPLRFHAAYASGEVRSRRRGRLFLGPLALDATDAIGDMEIGTDLRAIVANAAFDMVGDFTGATSGSTIVWSVFSPTTLAEGGTLEDAAFPVVQTSVPNRYAVQRRRAKRVSAVTIGA